MTVLRTEAPVIAPHIKRIVTILRLISWLWFWFLLFRHSNVLIVIYVTLRPSCLIRPFRSTPAAWTHGLFKLLVAVRTSAVFFNYHCCSHATASTACFLYVCQVDDQLQVIKESDLNHVHCRTQRGRRRRKLLSKCSPVVDFFLFFGSNRQRTVSSFSHYGKVAITIYREGRSFDCIHSLVFQ
jgi:hypothetical protein